MDSKTASEQFGVAEVSPAYWRVTFTNGPVNLVDPDTIDQLAALIFARRIAAFGKVAVSGIKRLVDVASLPGETELAAGLEAYLATSGRPENAWFVQALFRQGLQQPDGIELGLGLGTSIGRLRQESQSTP